MRKLFWLIPLLVFFLNPSFACTDEPQFQYGADEMRAAVMGDWSVTITPTGGTATQVTVHIDQSATAPATMASRAPGRAVVRAAHACGTRTLVKPAGACIDTSQMPLDVTYVSGDASFTSAALSGEFAVLGLAFVTGDLSLILGPYRILARVNADGSPGVANLVGVGQTGTVAVSR